MEKNKAIKKLIIKEEFCERFGHDQIKIMLQIFASYTTRHLPSEIKNEVSSEINLMLDVIKVNGSEVSLPVVIKSTDWLKTVNGLNGQLLKICLHDEHWPFQERIQLVGGLCEINEGKIDLTLFNYLNNSIEYWESHNMPCAIAISERVLPFIRTNEFSALSQKIRVISLSDEYKNHELILS